MGKQLVPAASPVLPAPVGHVILLLLLLGPIYVFFLSKTEESAAKSGRNLLIL